MGFQGSRVLSARSQAVIREVLGPINPTRPDFAKLASFRRPVLHVRDRHECEESKIVS